jgi:hypothetical protein
MATRTSLFSVLVLVAVPLLGAKGGCGGEVSLGDDACPTSACGGMPELACWDGSSPFTGKCLAKSDGTCGWEPRKCPDMPSADGGPIDGGPADAGPCTECEVPTIACADGSSPYGKCIRNAAGACVAEYLGCPAIDAGPADTGTPCERTSNTPRACATKDDCEVGLMQINCCGTLRAMGYSKSQSASFLENTMACSASYPGCGCASGPTTDDYGKTGTEFGFDCVSGKCMSIVIK